jgi:disulfide bond formation protein DsbB
MGVLRVMGGIVGATLLRLQRSDAVRLAHNDAPPTRMTPERLTLRTAFALGASACGLLLAFGYFLQFVKGLEPCPLCLLQRGFFYGVLLVFLIAAVHGPRGKSGIVYGVLGALVAAGGAAIASRQVWLQHLPADKVPQCGPDLFFMLENFPLAQTLKKLVSGTGECAVVDWTFLGLSIAEWSLAWFVALALYAAWLAWRSSTPAASA